MFPALFKLLYMHVVQLCVHVYFALAFLSGRNWDLITVLHQYLNWRKKMQAAIYMAGDIPYELGWQGKWQPVLEKFLFVLISYWFIWAKERS